MKPCYDRPIISVEYGKFPFIQISSPKGYAVDEEDGKHFHFEDVHVREPEAETVYKELTADIKKCTKPLYNAGRPIYSIRVSEKKFKLQMEQSI